MTDKQPTQEQIKEFIQWLGGEESSSGFIRLSPDLGWHHISYWERQVKSLDFLFRYAVPKLREAVGDYEAHRILSECIRLSFSFEDKLEDRIVKAISEVIWLR